MGLFKGILKNAGDLCKMTFIENNPLFEGFVEEQKKAKEKRENAERRKAEEDFRKELLEAIRERNK